MCVRVYDNRFWALAQVFYFIFGLAKAIASIYCLSLDSFSDVRLTIQPPVTSSHVAGIHSSVLRCPVMRAIEKARLSLYGRLGRGIVAGLGNQVVEHHRLARFGVAMGSPGKDMTTHKDMTSLRSSDAHTDSSGI